MNGLNYSACGRIAIEISTIGFYYIKNADGR